MKENPFYHTMKRIFYVFAILMALVACEDDDSFSTSTGMRLEFSVDTLQMDTVFSRTPSSTYAFWVHNRNNDGIRLSTVKLKRGNQTGFRVNVDGIYLDNSNGSQTSNVEIRKNDSILVFVELTASETRKTEPQLVEDDLLFILESGAEQKVLLQAWAWDAMKVYDPVIEADSLIESDVPIVIYGTMQVAQGATLFIRNTTLYFHDSSGLDVFGSLKTLNCVMRGDRLDDMFDYLPYDRVSGQWNGVHFFESSTDNELLDTEIRNPNYGIVCDSAELDTLHYRLAMQNCVIHNCVGNGLKAVNARISLDHCQLTNTGGDCVSIVGGMADISYCTLAQFYPFSADRGAAIRFADYQETSYIPLWRLACEGLIVTGYEDDVVMAEMLDIEDEVFEYDFRNCLLRTPAVTDDSVRFSNIIWETPNDSIQGKKHFITIDEENLIYDFHLDSLSTAKGLGCY